MDGRFTRRQLIKGSLAVAAAAPLLGTQVASAAQYRVDVATLPWPAANDIVARTALPTFPAATFPITAFGAKGDGKTDNTAAIKKAIDACNAAGGGHVIVTGGTFVTGAIYLKSDVDLHLESGAVLALMMSIVSRTSQDERVTRAPVRALPSGHGDLRLVWGQSAILAPTRRAAQGPGRLNR